MMTGDSRRIAEQRANPRLIRLWKALRPLQSVASFLNTGAHPDDEISAMLAALAFRDGLRIAYACANRGEGGQNNIGTERGADLGVLRTREMERAADEIGMGIYWLSQSPEDPIFDFGFSKSGDETFGHWGRERTIGALVRILRIERPDIVCPTFLDVPGQHGHHRAMTKAAHEAVAVAADPAAFPEQIKAGLAPWQVSKLYLPAWSGGGRAYDDQAPPPAPTVAVSSGDFDPCLGASYSQIGEWSRVFHKTQGMGRWLAAGPQSWPLHRAFSVPGLPDSETAVTDGLPSSLADLANVVETDAMARLLIAASGAIQATLAVWPDHDAVARTGAIAYHAVHSARTALSVTEAAAFGHRLMHKEHQLARVVAISGGVQVRVWPNRRAVVPGQRFTLKTEIFMAAGMVEGEPDLELSLPDGWTASSSGQDFDIEVPPDARTSDPYPARYEPGGFTDTIKGRLRFSVGGTAIETLCPLETGLHVLPASTVRIDPPSIVVNQAVKRQGTEFSLQITDNSASGGANGGNPEPKSALSRKVSFSQSGGWQVKINGEPGRSAKIDGSGAAGCTLSRSGVAKPGLVELGVKIDGEAAQTLFHGDYNHIGEVYRISPAVLRILTLKAELREGVRIGYIGGGNDAVGDNLRSLGAQVTYLDPEAFATASLSDFDTLVIGIFAFGSRPDLAKRQAEIHGWVRHGGNLVTLYHRPWDNWQPQTTPPAHLEIGQPSLRWRVTDANAKVKVLAPKHPLVTGPNKITAADWRGWVKERGLYFAAKWDDAYVPLIQLADPGEDPHKGALLSAQIGKGRHSHVSLILHHQMDNLVPGAFRLMANLVSATG